jgi:hypothetical protein
MGKIDRQMRLRTAFTNQIQGSDDKLGLFYGNIQKNKRNS